MSDTSAIDLSLGEFEALVAKALRGASYTWGLAADGARLARQLAEHSIDPVLALISVLAWADDTPLAARMPTEGTASAGPGAEHCPICVAATVSDRPPDLPAPLGTVVEPVLIVPAVQAMARHVGPVSLFTPTCTAVVSADGVVGLDRFTTGPVTLVASDVGPEASAPATRLIVTGHDLAILERYAHRTYAPATDASRVAGAGAGLSDND